jgi:hypothetical protein
LTVSESGSTQGDARALLLPFASIALTGALTLVMFVTTPLWELADTYCGTVARPTAGTQCSAIVRRRELWAVVASGAAAVGLVGLAIACWRARMRGYRVTGKAAALAAGGLFLALSLAATAWWLLLVGKDGEVCGSTLSRLDPYGTYSQERAMACESSYAASRHLAWIFGSGACATIAGATVVVARISRSNRAVAT